MQGYVQTRCPRCGNAAWGHVGQASPCHTCGLLMPPLAASPPAVSNGVPQPQWGAPPVVHHAPEATSARPPARAAGSGVSFKMPGGITVPVGPGMKLKVVGGLVVAIALAIGGYLVKRKLSTPKGMLGYAALGVDKAKPDADALYLALGKDAHRWKDDAMFWSLNYQAVRADGTVDTSRGAEVVYVSPRASAAAAKKTRADSVRKYGANASGVKPAPYGWNDPVKDLEPHPAATCQIKDVVALLAKQGLTGGKTVRITFDPKFADYYAWHVIGSDPKVDALYSWDDCSPIH